MPHALDSGEVPQGPGPLANDAPGDEVIVVPPAPRCGRKRRVKNVSFGLHDWIRVELTLLHMTNGPRYDLVVMAASAGGVKALQDVLASLPADFPVPICIVQHRTLHTPDLLPIVLAQRTTLRVKRSEPGETMVPGTVYLAPSDRHLIVNPDRTLELRDGRRIRNVLSSANPLFESAAEVTGKRTIGVVLTGVDSDGTDGVQAIKEEGGLVIAQDPATTRFPGMPRSAIRSGAVDYVLPVDRIGPVLTSLVQGNPVQPVAQPG